MHGGNEVECIEMSWNKNLESCQRAAEDDSARREGNVEGRAVG